MSGALTTAVYGRPSIISEELVQRVIRHLSNGNYLKPSVEASGIAYSTFKAWMAQGHEDVAAGRETLYSSLVARLTRAEADAEAALVEQLANEQDWRAKSFLLERRHRERWGKDDPGKQAAVVIQIQPGDAAALLDALSVAKRTLPAIDADYESVGTAANSPDSQTKLEAPANQQPASNQVKPDKD